MIEVGEGREEEQQEKEDEKKEEEKVYFALPIGRN